MPGVSDSQAQPISRALIARLRRVLGEDAVLTRPAQLLPYETDAMPLHQGRPGLVLLPAKTSQVVRTIKLLHDASVPWVPRGAGTGLSGGAVASASAAVLSVAKLRRVIQTDPARRRVRVEPGVVNLKLNESLHCHGLHFAPDPSSQMAATIGGNIAENAGGAHTLKYGVTSQHVLGLHLVLANGRALEIGGEEETMGGYDLMSFIVGSEGTLGLVADATLRLMPLPEATSTFMAVFASVSDASAAVGGILREGVVPAALEMIDSVVLRTLEEVFHVGFPLDAGALLVGEIDGLRESVDAQVRVVKQVLASCGVTDVQFAQTEKDREKLWEARKKAFGALGRVAPNYISHDAVIPRSCLPEVLARIAQVAERNDLRIANIFHAGDGNLHPAILFDGADAEQSRRAREAGEQIMRICLEAGGVLTGEHGVGMSKRHAMRWVFTEAELELMDGLRRVFDPWRRVNPGKILPVLSSDRDLDNTDSDGVGRVRAAGQDLPGLLPDSKAENPAHDRNVPQPRRHLSTFERAVSDAIREAVRKREGVVPIGGGTLLMVPLVHAQQVREAAGARDTGSGSAAPEETG
ncbi:MAG: FAD-binding protein, partial [Candidatus Eisenbacteria sp.]|nr:FAD-binding protein [Candidatus Eisenbacteria bacterium]